jgi:hypothetical protein
MVFNATSNNISVISWLSVLLGEETGVLGKNHRLVESDVKHHYTLNTDTCTIIGRDTSCFIVLFYTTRLYCFRICSYEKEDMKQCHHGIKLNNNQLTCLMFNNQQSSSI